MKKANFKKYRPLVFIAGLLCSYMNSYSQSGFMFHGNRFLLGKGADDSSLVIDPITQERFIHHRPREIATYMNGHPIVDAAALPAHEREQIDNRIRTIVFDALANSPSIRDLPDGILSVELEDFVIDNNGHLVFYEGEITYYGPDKNYGTNKDWRIIPFHWDQILLGDHKIKPAVLNGKKVIIRSGLSFTHDHTIVKDHRFLYLKDKGPKKYVREVTM